MDSDSLRPFEYTRVGDFYYTFTSRDGIPYNIYFIPPQGIFETKTEKKPFRHSSLDLFSSEAQRNGVFPMVLAVLRNATGRCLGVGVESLLS